MFPSSLPAVSLWLVLAQFAVASSGCAPESVSDTGTIATAEDITTGEPISQEVASPAIPLIGLTHLAVDGNRLVAGSATFPQADTMTATLDMVPSWIVSIPLNSDLVVAVVGNDGTSRLLRLPGSDFEETPLPALPPGFPPLLLAQDSAPYLVHPHPDASLLTHPIVNGNEHFLTTGAGGSELLHYHDEALIGELNTPLLPDARLVQADGLVAALASPTTEYGHGVLGDAVEAGAIALFSWSDQVLEENMVALPVGTVVEGIWPLFADVTGDATADLVVTLSNAVDGASVAAFDRAAGTWLVGPPIGQGYRWRHPMAVAPFGPAGELETAAVRTPHIGGILEFYRADETGLVISATTGGVTSHVLSSRNLDMGLAGDFNGDGRPEMVLPDQSRRILRGLQRVESGVEEVWTMDLGGTLSTNLAAVHTGTHMVLAAGRSDGTLLVFRSPR